MPYIWLNCHTEIWKRKFKKTCSILYKTMWISWKKKSLKIVVGFVVDFPMLQLIQFFAIYLVHEFLPQRGYASLTKILSAVVFTKTPSWGFGNFFHWYLCNHRYNVCQVWNMLWKVPRKKNNNKRWMELFWWKTSGGNGGGGGLKAILFHANLVQLMSNKWPQVLS